MYTRTKISYRKNNRYYKSNIKDKIKEGLDIR